MKKSLPKIIVVCGPTGSGKTGLAVLLCKKFNGEIINADSRQVYREMDIGTAKGLDRENDKYQITNCKQISNNKLQTIQGIPIHLVNLVNPNERYNVGQFKIDAEEAISDIISRGKVPFVVGGTGLYIDALVENYKFTEKMDWNDRRQSVAVKITDCRPSLQNQEFKTISNTQSISQYPNISISDFKNEKIEDLIKMLEKLDPEALTIVDLKNRRRIERAIEVCLTTGVPFTKQRTKGERQYEALKLAPSISLNREKLYEKINKRVGEMVDEGLEDEVRMLVEKYGWESEAMTGIGYREWRGYLENDKLEIPNYKQNPNDKSQISKNVNNIEEVVEKIRQDTRNYAKRQITWFKRPARQSPDGSSRMAGGDGEIDYVDLEGAEKLVQLFLDSNHSQ